MKSFETSGMFVQEMILVAFFLLILVEIRLLCIQHSRKRKVEVMAVNFLLLSVTYGILTDLLSDYLAIWEGKTSFYILQPVGLQESFFSSFLQIPVI